MDKSRQPVIVGVGRYTQFPRPLDECATPVGMLVEAARRAAADAVTPKTEAAGASAAGSVSQRTPSAGDLLRGLVAVGTPGMFLEARWRVAFGPDPPMYKNFSQSVARALGATPDPSLIWKSFPGGNGPQFLVNSFAELISTGRRPPGPVRVGGVEESATFDRAVRSGRGSELRRMGWSDCGDGAEDQPPLDPPVIVNRHGYLPENQHDIYRQINFHVGMATVESYAHYENALGHALGRTHDAHLDAICTLFSKFSTIAAAQPQHSWYPTERSPSFLKKVTKDNRVMSAPYRKWMIARDEIDQSAAVIMMSWAEAERRGIPEGNLVFLHGSETPSTRRVCRFVAVLTGRCPWRPRTERHFGQQVWATELTTTGNLFRFVRLLQ